MAQTLIDLMGAVRVMHAVGPVTSHLLEDNCYINIFPQSSTRSIARNYVKVRYLKLKKNQKK